VASSEQDSKNQRKKTESVRERAERAIAEASKSKKPEKKVEKKVEAEPVKKEKSTKSSTNTKKSSIRRGKNKSKKEKSTRRFHIVPRFIKLAFKEIKLVTWPDAKTTTRLTIAVILFATVFSIVVSLVDWVFGIIFKKVFLHG
jgi:preprotein translocase SecE subunit